MINEKDLSLAALTRRIAELERDNQHQYDDLHAALDELSRARAEAVNLKNSLGTSESSLRLKSGECSNLQSALDEIKALLAKRDKEIDIAERSIEALMKQKDNLAGDLKASELEVVALGGKVENVLEALKVS